jgi:hypothetical protein
MSWNKFVGVVNEAGSYAEYHVLLSELDDDEKGKIQDALRGFDKSTLGNQVQTIECQSLCLPVVGSQEHKYKDDLESQYRETLGKRNVTQLKKIAGTVCARGGASGYSKLNRGPLIEYILSYSKLYGINLTDIM